MWREVTPCLSYGGGEVGVGEVVTGLQGSKNTWVKHRQGCLILGDLCEKEKQFCIYQKKKKSSSVAMETVGGKGKWLEQKVHGDGTFSGGGARAGAKG